VLPLCYEGKPQNFTYLEKKTENNKNPRHTKCLKKVKIKLEMSATDTNY